MVFTKTLYFNTNNLGKAGNLILTFDDQDITGHKMYTDYYPVVWRVIPLQANGIFRYQETYEQQFLFTTAQLQEGKVTIGQAITPIDVRESTKLTGSKHTGYQWSDPKPITVAKPMFEAQNGSAEGAKISVATQRASPALAPIIPEPLLYVSSGFGSGDTLKVEFTARLRIYAVTDLEQGSVIESEIDSKKLWDHAIAEPNLPEEWVVTYDEGTEDFTITAA